MQNLFHLAFPVRNLEETRKFYGGVLGCQEGRCSDEWIDFNLFGHQIVAHLSPESAGFSHRNEVDEDNVPVPHFGIILSMDNFRIFAEHLRNNQVSFIIEPKIRFQGEIGEQATMFFLDPSGNALEFKAFSDPSSIFARE